VQRIMKLGLVVVASIGCSMGPLAGCSSTSSGDAPPAGLVAYITNAQDNGDSAGMGTVIPVDLETGKPVNPIDVGEGAGTNAIIVTADGTTEVEQLATELEQELVAQTTRLAEHVTAERVRVGDPARGTGSAA